MCSLVEIKNHDEIYIHYLSGETNNEQNIDINSNDLKGLDAKEIVNGDINIEDEVFITHINKGKDRRMDILKMRLEADRTSDRASSMGSSIATADVDAITMDTGDTTTVVTELEVTEKTRREMSTQVEAEINTSSLRRGGKEKKPRRSLGRW